MPESLDRGFAGLECVAPWDSREKHIAPEGCWNLLGPGMKCGNCGSDLPEDSIYCMVCGRTVGDAQSGVANYSSLPFGAIIRCPKCGAKNSRTDRWCGMCDADLEFAKKQSASPERSGPDCPRCGVKGFSGANYCSRCGAAFNPIASSLSLSVGGPDVDEALFDAPTHQHVIVRERQVIMIRCKYCGTLNGPEEKNCSSCGAQM